MPKPAPGEVVVEIAGCGVCHTDLGYYYDGVRTNHALPLCLGHEISGHVVAAGAGAEAWKGQAVIVPAVIPCGTCDACRRGKATICPNQKMPGNDIHGGFATHIVVPAHGLCPVDEGRLKAAGLDLADLSVVADAVTTPYQAVVQAGVAAGRSRRSSTASAASAATARRSPTPSAARWSRSTSATTKLAAIAAGTARR